MDQLFPFLYGASFVLLLVQAFRVMARGFKAVPRPTDRSETGQASLGRPSLDDRTGQFTVHPELLDANGHLIRSDLMTVRFSDENEESTVPPEAP
jgi:hypothetical protein